MHLFRTKAGVFSIFQRNDRWNLVFDGVILASYSTAAEAAADAASGNFSPRSGVDTATLGIPADLSKWESTHG